MSNLQTKHLDIDGFKIYNASAGSGKTYQLTKAYLKLILYPNSKQKYRDLLALTFTNKAVAEMKKRILESLFDFSKEETPKNKISLFKEVLQEINITPKELRLQSKIVLKTLLHNYAFFEISTIDKFTHNIIRTFARDLKISQSFDVVLDTDLLLDEAITRLLNKAGEDEKLTKVLINFSLRKIEDDKSWNITYDLLEIGKLLFQENHSSHLANLHDKEIDDFLSLQALLSQNLQKIEKEIVSKAQVVLENIVNKGFEFSDFPRETLPNHFKKLASLQLNTKALYGNKLYENLTEGKIVKANISKPTIEIEKFLLEEYIIIRDLFYKRQFLKNSHTNIIPLTVLNEIQKEVSNLQKEKDVLPISEFNALIAKEIKNQPVPFIYERLGEKYRHYFIDEFQDTSQMQWQNLIPLIGNAIESENEKGEKGSLLLVGDAKQAIYRWRGGKAEQFLNLLNLYANPFVVTPKNINLETNWRSQKEIINFNNSFFNFIANKLSNSNYKNLYKDGNKQKTSSEDNGYVALLFASKNTEEEEDSHCIKTLEVLEKVLEKKYSLGDICILVRDNKKGAAIADFITKKGYAVISPDSLLLANDKSVSFLVSLLQYIENSDNNEAIYAILDYLYDKTGNKHDFIAKNLITPSILLKEKYGFKINTIKSLSTYDILEQAILHFKLAGHSDGHLSHFMDEVFDYSQKEDSSIFSFLNYWSHKSGTLSVKAPESLNAVQVMTIHKAKGLEFPIVIFPYADAKIVDYRNKKIWLPIEKESYAGYNELLINYNKELENYNDTAKEFYNEEQGKLELDAYNVLYVALTRAENALFIITNKDYKKDTYSEFFIEYLKNNSLWNSSQSFYYFGNFLEKKKKDEILKTQETIPYIYSQKSNPNYNIVAKATMLWNIERQEAIQKGNLIHKILSKVHYQKDIVEAINFFNNSGDIVPTTIPMLEEKLKQVVFHSQLSVYYEEGLTIYNEKELISPEGILLRPDRLVAKDKSITIIDYKTGTMSKTHKNQLLEYATILKQMNYVVKDMILVYINDTVKPIFI